MGRELQPGDPLQVGPYRIVEVLGSGGMGRVYLGRSRGGHRVAVKVIRPEVAAIPDFRARFRREVTAARRVSGMYTAPVVAADPDGAVPWLATAYIDGPSLADAVRDAGPLSGRGLRDLAAGLAEGLAAIHAAGLVHRDLKPSNVLLSADGPRIIDFGIVWAAEASSLTRTDHVIGSPGYMSPEQAEPDAGIGIGPASDIFSLGAVLCYAATGHGPWRAGSTTAALLYQVVHGEPRIGDVPAEMHPLIAACLAKDPVSRPTAEAILAALGGREETDGGPAAQSNDASDGAVIPPLTAAVGQSPLTGPTTETVACAAGSSVEPSPLSTAPAAPPQGVGDSSPRHTRSGRRLRVVLALVGVVSAMAIVVSVILLRTVPSGPGTKPPPLSAAAAVTAVQPDRLSQKLLDTPFAPGDMPEGTTAAASQLSDSATGITVYGLVATVDTKLSGPAESMWVTYYLFNNPGDAAAYYSAAVPEMTGYRAVSPLAGPGIGDPTKCQAERAAAQPQWGWVCLTLSSSVVSYTATKNGTDTGDGQALTLARDAVRQLRSVALATARDPFPQPPGLLQPSALLAQVHRPFASSLIPGGVSSPVLSNSTNTGTGLLGHDRVRDLFSGSGTDYTGAEVVFYVFDSAQDAQTFFSVDWVPYENGKPDTQTGETVDPSGLPDSQQAECHSFIVAATHVGIGECYVQWGDVVVEGLTSDTRNPDSASLNMALTLAQSGLLSVGAAITS